MEEERQRKAAEAAKLRKEELERLDGEHEELSRECKTDFVFFFCVSVLHVLTKHFGGTSLFFDPLPMLRVPCPFLSVSCLVITDRLLCACLVTGLPN